MTARTILAAALLLGTSAFGPAFAQSTPNADQIVKSLTPTQDMAGGTRGIRIGNAPAAKASSAAKGAATEAKAPSASLAIQFATGSADLTPAAVRSLDQLGKALGTPSLAAYRFRVEGHTDTVGTPDANKTLSQRRAEAVVEYLTGKYQIDTSRLQAIGMGEEGLAVTTPDQTPEARNRRVVVVNVGS